MAFSFAIIGAAQIANKFCNAVQFIEDCAVVAVASKSEDRARIFAARNSIPRFYDDYEQMLVQEKPDCVYIAVTQDAHLAMANLCLKHRIPILCEKAMFLCEADARDFFERSEKAGVFSMEAMWSRFLPPIEKAREWILDKKIGEARFVDSAIGWKGPYDLDNRFFNPKLGGGAMYDLAVYCYEISDFLLGKKPVEIKAQCLKAPTGVDEVDSVTARYDGAISQMKATFVFPMEERIVVYGTEGKIVIPKCHFATEAFLYDCDGNEKEHFVDGVTKNGFIYEAKEAMCCIKEKKLQSERVPHSLTIECAKMFDEIKRQADIRV